ncbi:hypothetical protein [Luteimonas abyssi]|uniref:hypothetical protein n=1 Tax=Luteimonas abyssi TaxID=1247514 RepID=UPI0012FC3B2F|nr:hypothetical protein [Luteimonas abyssi]
MIVAGSAANAISEPLADRQLVDLPMWVVALPAYKAVALSRVVQLLQRARPLKAPDVPAGQLAAAAPGSVTPEPSSKRTDRIIRTSHHVARENSKCRPIRPIKVAGPVAQMVAHHRNIIINN